MVESEIPDASVDHPVGAECHGGANDCSGDNIVPVVEFVDRQCTSYQSRAEDGHVGDDEFPVSWVVVGPDFQLCVEV